jgi:hypothetical protein
MESGIQNALQAVSAKGDVLRSHQFAGHIPANNGSGLLTAAQQVPWDDLRIHG